MKRLLIIPFLFFAVSVGATKYYLAPTGNDATGAGTIGSPWFTINKAWTVVAAGDTVYLRGGTYAFLSQQRPFNVSGTAGNMINVWAYPTEQPILTKHASYSNNYYITYALVELHGDYTYWQGIEIANFPQMNTSIWSGMAMYQSDNNKLERMNIHHCGHGLNMLQCDGNLILNSDFHHNYDPLTSGSGTYGSADGIGVEQTAAAGTNTVRGCRAYRNSDDGIDCWASEGMAVIDSCWSWHNGYRENGTTTGGDGNGIKLGATSTSNGSVFGRTITNCIVFKNRNNGIDQNLARTKMYIYNNSVWDNRNNGIILSDYNLAHIVRNNVSFDNDNENYWGTHTNATVDHNSYDDGWQPAGPVASSVDFLSIDTTGVSGARGANGELPDVDFLKLASESDLKDAGVDVGIAYYGLPQLGAYEYVPQVPAVDASVLTQSIHLWVRGIYAVGNVIDDGNGEIYDRGFCWSTSANPTVAGDHTSDGTTTGVFSSKIYSLLPNTIYHIRAYVTNEVGTTYGDDLTGTTPLFSEIYWNRRRCRLNDKTAILK